MRTRMIALLLLAACGYGEQRGNSADDGPCTVPPTEVDINGQERTAYIGQCGVACCDDTVTDGCPMCWPQEVCRHDFDAGTSACVVPQ